MKHKHQWHFITRTIGVQRNLCILYVCLCVCPCCLLNS